MTQQEWMARPLAEADPQVYEAVRNELNRLVANFYRTPLVAYGQIGFGGKLAPAVGITPLLNFQVQPKSRSRRGSL